MSWTTVGPASASWTTEGTSAQTYSADTQTSRVWSQLSPIVVEGVDFRLQMTESYPMRMTDDRPPTIADVFPEGMP